MDNPGPDTPPASGEVNVDSELCAYIAFQEGMLKGYEVGAVMTSLLDYIAPSFFQLWNHSVMDCNPALLPGAKHFGQHKSFTAL
jgi:hypothetical protein